MAGSTSGPRGRLGVSLASFNSAYGGKLYLPYSVGLLSAYARGRDGLAGRVDFLPMHYEMGRLEETAGGMARADVVGFSCYSWNWRLSLATAARLREINPQALIVLGGPSVPNDPADFFDSHPGIDLLCHGEGEESFAEILEAMLAGRAPSRIAGTTHYERGTGQVTANPPRQRFRDLTPIPSPYLGGIFDGLLAGRPDVEWMALWETNRGCPFSCSFCEWGGADTTKLRRFDMDRLGAEIDWFARHEIGWIFCCDANFGILKRDLEIAQLLTRAKRARGYPQEFRVCYTKNSSGRIIELAKLFDQAEMGKGVSISMQSLNPDTLKRIKRVNMAASDFATLQGKFAAQGLVTFTEMIVALPGETYDSFAAGLETLLDCGQHGGINIYNCSILPNSEMAEPEYQKAHGIQTVDIPVFQPHSSPPEAGAEVIEGERIAVATDSLPIEDWRRVQRFAWAVQCFHLLGMLQAVALTLKNAMGVGYRDFYESLIAHGLDNPRGLVGGELARLDAVLVNVLAGKGFDQYLEGFLDVTWPHEEASLLRLSECRDAFYDQARAWVQSLLKNRGVAVEDGFLEDLFAYQKAIAKHFRTGEEGVLSLSWPLPDYVAACRSGAPGRLVREAARYRVQIEPRLDGDKQRYAREVVWFGRKGGRYLYDVERLDG